jgi:BMFP domain-containing protein YqiC
MLPRSNIEETVADQFSPSFLEFNPLAASRETADGFANMLGPFLQEDQEARNIHSVQQAVELIGAQTRAMLEDSERMSNDAHRALSETGSISTNARSAGTQRQRLNRLLVTEEQQRNEVDILEDMLRNTRQHLELLRRREVDLPSTTQTSRFGRMNRRLGLDSLPRPETLRDDQMSIKLECGICLQQIANIACLPCGHVVMCEW